MKVLKKAMQKNIPVVKDNYTDSELRALKLLGITFEYEGNYFVYLAYLDKLDIRYNKVHGYYEAVGYFKEQYKEQLQYILPEGIVIVSL